MVHVAREMERAGIRAAAADWRRDDQQGAHRRQDRARLRHAVVHVLDASRAVGVVGSLINRAAAGEFAENVRADYDRVRAGASGPRAENPPRHRRRARTSACPTDWATVDIPTPSFTGVRTHRRLPLRELVPYIDWSPFFHTWELRGRYPGHF